MEANIYNYQLVLGIIAEVEAKSTNVLGIMADVEAIG